MADEWVSALVVHGESLGLVVRGIEKKRNIPWPGEESGTERSIADRQ